MKTERQLTSRLPWVDTFDTTIEEKLNELNSALNTPDSNPIETVLLTREAVEGIAFNASTPEDIAVNFQAVIKSADEWLEGDAVAPYRVIYALNVDGLKA